MTSIEDLPIGAGEVALAFTAVPLDAPALGVASACLDIVRRLTGGSARLSFPTRPVPLAVGDPPAALELRMRFPPDGGEGELWLPPESDPLLSVEGETALASELSRVWKLLHERAVQSVEMDQLRFHLNALQQVARTLATIRGRDETERLVLDSVGEVFFAWWAALYRQEGEVYVCRAVRSLRGESVAREIPMRMVRELAAPGGGPVLPPEDSELRDQIPAEVAVIAPLELGEDDAGLLILGRRMTEAPYEAHDLALLRALADSSAVALRNADLLDRLRAQATLDPLTGCHNRRGFDEILENEIARSKRNGRPLSLVLLDIDHFKRINDELGHESGDFALQRIGRTVRHAFRTSDSACRHGGEEFAVIFPETPKEEGEKLAERLRALIEALPPSEEVPRVVTASLGISAYPEDGADAGTLLRAADRALYRAKAAGRNAVRSA